MSNFVPRGKTKQETKERNERQAIYMSKFSANNMSAASNRGHSARRASVSSGVLRLHNEKDTIATSSSKAGHSRRSNRAKSEPGPGIAKRGASESNAFQNATPSNDCYAGNPQAPSYLQQETQRSVLREFEAPLAMPGMRSNSTQQLNIQIAPSGQSKGPSPRHDGHQFPTSDWGYLTKGQNVHEYSGATANDTFVHSPPQASTSRSTDGYYHNERQGFEHCYEDTMQQRQLWAGILGDDSSYDPLAVQHILSEEMMAIGVNQYPPHYLDPM